MKSPPRWVGRSHDCVLTRPSRERAMSKKKDKKKDKKKKKGKKKGKKK